MTRTAVVTVVAGREQHLRQQRRGLVRAATVTGGVVPDVHVVVRMGSDQAVVDEPGLHTVMVDVARPTSGLPLAAARNAGADRALAEGAEVLVLLDVDCIPAPRMLQRYRGAAATHPDALLAGPVAYLPPAPAVGYDLDTVAELARPHPARPVPPDGAVVAEPRTELFWSLSFALTSGAWRRTGGFHPGYTGYGAEDTDFALVAAAAGVGLHWVGGAVAHHQDHGPSGPTPANTPSIVDNAHLFHSRHGWWPMGGWLRRLHDEGRVVFEPDAGVLRIRPGVG